MSPADTPPQTIFFETCRAVFQGGGCRCAAHVGAYETALEAGINFSEVAGTSAGAIIAALIGAGASANYLRQHCATLSFSELLGKPKNKIDTGWLGKLLRFPSAPFSGNTFREILVHGAVHSSDRIETWVEDHLRCLLPDTPSPIPFGKLVMPTWIVATNLTTGRPEIWSTYETENESVAFAVRCSCTIPLFFEPVEKGNNFYADGGMLSNLPAFVYSDDRTHKTTLGGRVLAFSLEADAQAPERWTIANFLRQLVNAIVGGATDLQIRMQPHVSVVRIDTGDIRATDFNIDREQVDTLISSGRRATIDFVRNEVSRLGDAVAIEITTHSEDELFDRLVREALSPGTRLIVSLGDTTWFWRLFPTVAAWREAGAAIHALLSPPAGDQNERAREEQRRRTLQRLGARVQVMDTLPFRGFLLCRQDDNREAAFLLSESRVPYAPYASSYVGSKHRSVIRAVKALVENHIINRDTPQSPMSFAEITPDQIIARLKSGVWQYTPAGVSITLEKMRVDDVSLIVRRVRSYKYRQISHLAKLYDRYGIPLFAPAAVNVSAETVSVVTPPVVEEWASQRIAIEGNSRFFYMRRYHMQEAVCLVVRGVSEPLPGRPVHPARVLLCEKHLEPHERIDGFDHGQFRSIEGAARPTSQ